MLIKRLKEARLRAGFSQEKLGVLAGIDEASASARMNQYERGKHTPDFDMVCKFAKTLDVPENYFYTIDDVMAETVLNFNKLNSSDKKEVVNYINSFLKDGSQ